MEHPFKVGDEIVKNAGEHLAGARFKVTNVYERDGRPLIAAVRWVKKTAKWSGNAYLYSPDRFTKV